MGNLSEHFDREEFACKCGCGFDTVDYELVNMLELIRDVFNDKPIHINSGCRCKRYNSQIGGSENSQHMLGKAADFIIKGYDPEEVQQYLLAIQHKRFGIGRYPNFTHFDVRDKAARWNG